MNILVDLSTAAVQKKIDEVAKTSGFTGKPDHVDDVRNFINTKLRTAALTEDNVNYDILFKYGTFSTPDGTVAKRYRCAIVGAMEFNDNTFGFLTANGDSIEIYWGDNY